MSKLSNKPTEKDWVDWAGSVFSTGRFDILHERVLIQKTFDQKDSHIRTTFARLLERLATEYDSLGHDYKFNKFTSLSLLAWRARNLLEINVWCRFCCLNKNNAKLFFEEGGKDYLDLREKLHDWGEETKQSVEWLAEQGDAKKIVFSEANRHGIIDLNSDFMTVHKAAKECGFNKTFKIDNKIFSKYSHPTAYCLFVHDDPQVTPKQAYTFVSKGCMYFYDAFCRLEKFIAQDNLD